MTWQTGLYLFFDVVDSLIYYFNPLLPELRKLILQTFHHFTYVTTHSPTLPSLYVRHGSFPKHSVALPTSHFILQPFFRFSYVTSSSLNSPGEHPMSRTPFSNLSVTSPTSQLILQPFRRFTYATAHSPTLPLLHLLHVHSPTLLSLLLRHKFFT